MGIFGQIISAIKKFFKPDEDQPLPKNDAVVVSASLIIEQREVDGNNIQALPRDDQVDKLDKPSRALNEKFAPEKIDIDNTEPSPLVTSSLVTIKTASRNAIMTDINPTFNQASNLTTDDNQDNQICGNQPFRIVGYNVPKGDGGKKDGVRYLGFSTPQERMLRRYKAGIGATISNEKTSNQFDKPILANTQSLDDKIKIDKILVPKTSIQEALQKTLEGKSFQALQASKIASAEGSIEKISSNSLPRIAQITQPQQALEPSQTLQSFQANISLEDVRTDISKPEVTISNPITILIDHSQSRMLYNQEHIVPSLISARPKENDKRGFPLQQNSRHKFPSQFPNPKLFLF